MTAEKPEGDVVALLVKLLRARCECEPDINFQCLTCSASYKVESQATRIATLSEALRELVAVKDLKDAITPFGSIDKHGADNWELMTADYKRRKPLAWEAARRALSAGQGEAK